MPAWQRHTVRQGQHADCPEGKRAAFRKPDLAGQQAGSPEKKGCFVIRAVSSPRHIRLCKWNLQRQPWQNGFTCIPERERMRRIKLFLFRCR